MSHTPHTSHMPPHAPPTQYCLIESNTELNVTILLSMSQDISLSHKLNTQLFQSISHVPQVDCHFLDQRATQHLVPQVGHKWSHCQGKN